MKKILSFFALLLFISTLMAQTSTLTFTGRDANNHFIPLNRVVITNLTKGWQETIYYPDTILVMSSVSIEDYGKVEGFNLSQNSPNPFDGTSDFSLCLPKDGQVSIEVYDLNGKKITSYNNTLSAGCHVFRVLLSTAQSYFLTARSGNDQASIKMINTGNAGSNALLYIGEGNMQPLSVKLDNNSKGQTEHPFSIGDNMEYVGYAVVNGEEYESQHIQQVQNASENFILNFDCVANPNVSIQSLTITNILASSATLSANVTSNTDGQQLQRGFQYDTDAAFANAVNVACGTGNGNFSTNITGLQDATLYYVRAFATYHTATTYSDATTFTTLCNPLSISISGNSSICNGSSTTLTATGADTYQWSPATGLNVQTGSNVVASPTESTVYTVIGTSANGCTGTANVSVIVNQTYNIGTTAEICPGDSYNFFGQTLTAAGTYNHTLQSVQGCDSVITLTLSLKQVPNINVSGNTTICQGASTVLTATGASTYLWTPATGLSSTTSDVVTANPSTSTSYSVAGTAANGCTGFANVLVTVLTLPNISIVGNTDVCQGTSTILAANGAIAYQWSPATGLSTTIGNIVTATPNTSTLYTVTGIDANGCSNTTSVQINVHSTPGTTIADNFCQGTSYNFYGQQLTQGGVYTHTLQSIYGCDSVITLILTQKNAPSVSITGERAICQNGNSILTANGANTYQWLPAEGMSTTSGPAVVVTPSVSTNYTVVGTAANGCTGSASAFVEVHPVYQTNVSQSICQGQSYNFYGQILTNAGIYNHTLQSIHGCDSVITLTLFVQEISVNGTTQICENGSTTLTVAGVNNALWTPSTGLSSATGNTVIASPSSTTIYNVSGSSSSGCSLSTTVTITVHPNYRINRTAEICQGQTYSFYGQQLSTSGTYSHTLQSVHGCDSVISLQLTVHPLPSVNISGDNAICEGDTATLTANGANTYQWSPATGLSATSGNSVSAYPAESVIYTVNGTDTNGCVGSATHLLVVDELPNISISGNTTVNYGSSTTLTATGASTYQWSTGATGNTLTVLPQSSTNYSVTGTNTAGCSSTQSIAVTVNPVAPSVSTQSATNVSDSSAFVSGTLISHGGDANISVGFQYATNNSFSDASTIAASVNNFNCTISGLDMSTTYYVRAYATNSVGTTYGNTVSFTTLTCNLASVTTSAIDTTLMTKVSVTVSGSVTNSGGCQVTSKGFCWSTNPYPAITDNVIAVDTNSNNFVAVLRNLQSLTTYYLRAFAVTHAGVAYGNRVQFKTLSANLAELTTTDVSNVQAYSATSGGRVLSAGHPVTARGVCWSTAPAPSISDAHTTDGSGVGSFTSSITGLADGTTYYVRAYATIDEGTAYGNEYAFTTLSVPLITTNNPNNVTSNTVTLGGNVLNQGADSVIERGVCYGLSANPTVEGNHKIVGSGVGDFSCNLTGLNSGTTYYVRAYATNGRGTAYGEQKTFTTASFTCGTSTIADIDNNVYQTVLIGNQCWMKQNLRTTHYSSGTAIALGSDTSSTTGYYYYPNDDNTIVNTYGLLYNWTAVMNGALSDNAMPSTVKGICPIGWHLPSDAEWGVLAANVGNQLSFLCDENSLFIAKALASTSGWNNSSVTCAVGNVPSSNNATGFNVLPAGQYSGSFGGFGYQAYFWSTTQNNSGNACFRGLNYDSAGVHSNNVNKNIGFSVRCLRDVEGLPSVVTKPVTNIQLNGTATCGGFVESQGNSSILARGVCWSTSPNPTIADSHTSDGIGMGNYSSNITNLSGTTTYYVRAYATNSMGTTYGTQISFTTPFYCGVQNITDIDNNTYNTVQIGNQCWMRENLKTTKYADGTSISLGSSTSTTTAYRYCPNNDANNVSTYGFLYNWAAVMHNSLSSSSNPSGVQGICPSGWHVPSYAEFKQLTDYVKSQSQYLCGSSSSNIAKALASTTGWGSTTNTCAVGNNSSANNATGFSAVPAGGYDGSYYNFGDDVSFWSSTESTIYYAYSWYLSCYYAIVYSNNHHKNVGNSVRCVKN